MEKNKELVHDFWNDASCGENLYLHGDTPREAFNNQLTKRYELEPYIIDFADFAGSQGKKVLEIGVGLGADHQKFAESGAQLWGCDLTSRAIEYTQKRLELFSFSSTLQTADAENLPYENGFFDKRHYEHKIIKLMRATIFVG
jgi:2-polyprenyl-3-methyl-5-hydroxy-6-metoxy-1,4-benzoquinol methylase